MDQAATASFAQTSPKASHTQLLTQTYLRMKLSMKTMEELCVDDSEDDLAEWQQEEMNKDEEFQNIMDFVFGQESDEDC